MTDTNPRTPIAPEVDLTDALAMANPQDGRAGEGENIPDGVIADVERFLRRQGGFSAYAAQVASGTTGWSRLRSNIWLAVHHRTNATSKPPATLSPSPTHAALFAGDEERAREVLAKHCDVPVDWLVGSVQLYANDIVDAMLAFASSRPEEERLRGAGDEISLLEAARDLLDARENGPHISERYDLWNRLREIVEELS